GEEVAVVVGRPLEHIHQLGSEREAVGRASLHRNTDGEAHPRTDSCRLLAVLVLVAQGGGNQAADHGEARLRRDRGGKGKQKCERKTRAKPHWRTSDMVGWPLRATVDRRPASGSATNAPYGTARSRFQQ